MINTIKYYYNIITENIKQIGKDYYFDDYVLKYDYREIDIELYNMLILNNYKIDQIIYNKDNSYITFINNEPYILFKRREKEYITFDLINSFNIRINAPQSRNWAKLWEYKIDNYEKNIDNVNDEIIKNSFNYFVGIAENAISLFKMLELNEDIYISHIRLNNDDEFYNLLNLTLDYKERDIAGYIKKEFFLNNSLYYEYIEKYIYYSNYNKCMLLFIRLMYPTQYFDSYDNYMKNESIDYSFYYKLNEYEIFLKKIYKLLKNKYQIPKINWLD